MIGSAIGGDGNCVNGVIITNLEAISSRPDQSEDAPPFPEPGPFLPFLVSDSSLPTVIEFLSSSFSNPESHSPRRRRRHRRRRRRRRCISVVVSLCDTRKFTLIPIRLHSRTSRSFLLCPPFCVTLPLPLFLSFSLSLSHCAKRLPVRWGGTTSENLRRRSFLAFACNNDLFYDSDSSPSSALSFSPSAHPTDHASSCWCQISIKLGRISGLPIRVAIRHIISLVRDSSLFHPHFHSLYNIVTAFRRYVCLDRSSCGYCYKRSFLTFFILMQYMIRLFFFFFFNFAANLSSFFFRYTYIILFACKLL